MKEREKAYHDIHGIIVQDSDRSDDDDGEGGGKASCRRRRMQQQHTSKHPILMTTASLCFSFQMKWKWVGMGDNKATVCDMYIFVAF